MKTNSVLSLIAIATVLFAFLAFASVQAALTWKVQLVKEYVWAGGNCPIVEDQNSSIHIAYLDGYTLVYASYNGHEWTNQTIATSAIYLIFSLVLDSKGYPHILYEQKLAGPLKIADWNGESWETIDTGVVYTDFAALAVDSFGSPQIVYTTTTTNINHDDWAKNTVNTSLIYARWTGAGWSTQTVDTVLVDGLSAISLTLSEDNLPYVLYSPSSNHNNIKLATGQLNWKIQTVELPNSTGNCGNIVVDSRGYPHFLCTQVDQDSEALQTILYATFNLSTWSTQAIASKIDLGSIANLVLDSKDNPHFTYSTSDGEGMYVAYTGSTWQNETLPKGVAAGPLAIDKSGNPHLLYRVYSPARYCSGLMYATASGTISSVQSSNTPGTRDNTIFVVTIAIVIMTVIAVASIWKKPRHSYDVP